MKTFKELISELKASTLGSYIGKATLDKEKQSEKSRVAYGKAFMAKSGSKDRKNAESDYQKADQKATNRIKGINQAQSRLTDVRYQRNEEIEQIDELEKGTMMSFAKKSARQAKNIMWNEHPKTSDPAEKEKLAKLAVKKSKAAHMAGTKISKLANEDVELDETSYEKNMNPNKPVIVKGVKGMKSTPFTKKFKNQAAYEKWADSDASGDYTVHQVMNEDVEELDELNKSTLSSYIKKASHDVATRSAAVARYAEREHIAKERDDYEDARKNRKISDKQFDKSWNRRKGIATAVDKLAKEDVDLDEAKLNPAEGAWHVVHPDTGKIVSTHKGYAGASAKMKKLSYAAHKAGQSSSYTAVSAEKYNKDNGIKEGTNNLKEWNPADPNAYGEKAFKKGSFESNKIVGFLKKKEKKTTKPTTTPDPKKLKIEGIEYIDEVLSPEDPAEKWIHDFVHSDNPMFKGKTKKERIQMALAARYSAQRKNK